MKMIKSSLKNLLEIWLAFNAWRYEFNHWIQYFLFTYRAKSKVEVCQSKLVSIIIPALGEGRQTNPQYEEKREYYFFGLKRLLSHYLSNQTYKNYEAIVYCDGPNKRIQSLVNSLNDLRLKVYALERQTNLFGHPQTRRGIMIAKGDFFIRMNCDNHPYPEYLKTLVNGFEEGIGVVYGRVIFKEEARRVHKGIFLNKKHRGISNDLRAFILPRDKQGILRRTNIDCMNYIVRMDLAKKHVDRWNNDFAADWYFIESLLQDDVKVKFVDKLIGNKC